jgi:hypothetical protein
VFVGRVDDDQEVVFPDVQSALISFTPAASISCSNPGARSSGLASMPARASSV